MPLGTAAACFLRWRFVPELSGARSTTVADELFRRCFVTACPGCRLGLTGGTTAAPVLTTSLPVLNTSFSPHTAATFPSTRPQLSSPGTSPCVSCRTAQHQRPSRKCHGKRHRSHRVHKLWLTLLYTTCQSLSRLKFINRRPAQTTEASRSYAQQPVASPCRRGPQALCQASPNLHEHNSLLCSSHNQCRNAGHATTCNSGHATTRSGGHGKSSSRCTVCHCSGPACAASPYPAGQACTPISQAHASRSR